MDSIAQTKTCKGCHIEKPLSEFYPRSGYTKPEKPPTNPGHYITECKSCMKERSKNETRLPKTIPRAATEIIALDMLKRAGIPALPGKAVHAADVDIVCYGSVWVETKYSTLYHHQREDCFKFNLTPKQQGRGLLADLVMLICEYPDGNRTAHLFSVKHPVFYMNGKLKSGLIYTVGLKKQRKFTNSRTVMTEPMMIAAQDAFWLIKQRLSTIEEELKRGETLPFELATRLSSDKAA